MRRGTRIVGVLAAVLAVAALLILLARSPARGSTGRVTRGAAAADSGATLDSRPEPARTRVAAEPDSLASAAGTSSPKPATKPEDAKARAHPLVVTGTVLASDGEPIEGAELLLDREGNAECLARSDASGALRGGLQERPRFTARFTVLADGFAGAHVQTREFGGEELRLGTFRLAPGGELSGRVVDAGGSGIVDADVAWLDAAAFPADVDAARVDGPPVNWDWSRFWPSAVTDSGGHFRVRGIPLGEGFLVANAQGWQYGWTRVLEIGRAPPGEQEIVLPRSPEVELAIAGVVRDPRGAPLAGVRILRRGLGRGELDALRDLGYASGSPRTRGAVQEGTTDDEGRFRILLDSAEPVELGALDPEERWATTWVGDVMPGTSDVAIVMQPPVWLVLRLVDADARPVPWGHVRLANVTRDGGREGVVRVHRPEAAFEVEVSAPGFRKEKLGPLEPPPEGDELRLTLTPGHALRGRVVFDGRPVAGARIDLARTWPSGELRESTSVAPMDRPFVLIGGGGDDRADGTSDRSGAFVLTIHDDGWHRLAVEAEGFPRTVFGPYPLDREAGGTGLVLELLRGGVLEGHLRTAPAAEPRERLVAVSNGWGVAWTAPVDADGRYRIEDLPPGSYQVRPCEPPVASVQRLDLTKTTEALVWDCRVRSGETTRYDLDLTDEGSVVLAGRFELVGAEPGEWKALLLAASAADEAWPQPRAVAPVGSDGSFELVVSRPGRYRLELRSRALLRFFEDLELFAGTRVWHGRAELGRLALRPSGRSPSGVPSVLVYTASASGALSFHAQVDWNRSTDDVRLEVPLGPGRLLEWRDRRASQANAPWTTLAEVTIERGKETVIEVP